MSIADGTPYVIPLTQQNQSLSISLTGVTYQLKLRWCAPAACWTLDVSDDTGNPLLQGAAVVTGCDILEQLEYLGIGGALVAQSTDDPDLVPSLTTLGLTGNLFFVLPPVAS